MAGRTEPDTGPRGSAKGTRCPGQTTSGTPCRWRASVEQGHGGWTCKHHPKAEREGASVTVLPGVDAAPEIEQLRTGEQLLAALERLAADAELGIVPARTIQARTAIIVAARAVLESRIAPDRKTDKKARPVRFGKVSNMAEFRQLQEANARAKAAGDGTD